MPWKMSHRSNDDVDKVIEVINGDLDANVSTQGQSVVAKVALSDQQNGDARGVLYYWSDDEPPSISGGTSEWGRVDFASETDYDGMYKNALSLLNGYEQKGVTLKTHQAAAARVCFTNRRHGDAHLVVYYPVD